MTQIFFVHKRLNRCVDNCSFPMSMELKSNVYGIFTSSPIKFSILEACLSRWNIFFDRKCDDPLK